MNTLRPLAATPLPSARAAFCSHTQSAAGAKTRLRASFGACSSPANLLGLGTAGAVRTPSCTASATLRTWPRLSRRRPRWSGGCTNPQPRDHSSGWGGGTCSPKPSQIQLYATAQRRADPHSLQWLLTERLFADGNCCRDACKAFDLAAGKKPGEQTMAPLDTVTVCVLQLRALPRADLHKQRQSRADIWHTTAAHQRFPAGNQLQSTTARAVIVMRGLPP